MPPSVGVGSATARSGTSCEPSTPPTFLKATSPSLVIVSSDPGLNPASAGSTEATGFVDKTRSVPPRCSSPVDRTAT